jgi:hypothetical protein
MKIFYSWQSDTPKEVGRTFIREALDAAVAGIEVDEPDRPTIDQDTQGVLGSPVIADTILLLCVFGRCQPAVNTSTYRPLKRPSAWRQW